MIRTGGIMRKYNLFVIRKDVYQYYSNNTKALFNMLQDLYYLKKEDFEYGYSLFHQICEPFDVERLKFYFEDKYKLKEKNGKYQFEDTYIYLKPARVVIKTNVNLPGLFMDFKCYNRLIFVVDFEMKDYFFLCGDYNNRKHSYI